MKRYRIRYRDADDPGCPEMTVIYKGYDKVHAIERFWESPDGEGWEITGVTLVA